jgi:hypothetical protein
MRKCIYIPIAAVVLATATPAAAGSCASTLAQNGLASIISWVAQMFGGQALGAPVCGFPPPEGV